MSIPPFRFPPPSSQNSSEPEIPSNSQTNPTPRVSERRERGEEGLDRESKYQTFKLHSMRAEIEGQLIKLENELKQIVVTLKQKFPASERRAIREQLQSEIKKIASELKELERALEKDFRLEEDERKEGAKEKKHEKKHEKKDVAILPSLPEKLIADHSLAEAQMKGTEALSPTLAKQEVSKIIALIQKMVEGIQVGSVGASTFTTIELKKTVEVPTFLIGGTITIQQNVDEKGLTSLHIQFTNLTTAQERNALFIIEQNKSQLQQLMQNLESKRMLLANMQIGSYTVSLPAAIAPLPHITAPPEATLEKEQGGEREGGEEEGGGQGGQREGEG